MEWENQGIPYGVKTLAYSFYNHIQEGSNPIKLTYEELQEGFEHIKIANETLKRSTPEWSNLERGYCRNLLARNWYQVKNADAIYAIGTFTDNKHIQVSGGTGWTVQMAIDNKKPTFVFDQNNNRWFWWVSDSWILFHPPKLPENFAGVGTRKINESGKQAIGYIYKLSFGAEYDT